MTDQPNDNARDGFSAQVVRVIGSIAIVIVGLLMALLGIALVILRLSVRDEVVLFWISELVWVAVAAIGLTWASVGARMFVRMIRGR